MTPILAGRPEFSDMASREGGGGWGGVFGGAAGLEKRGPAIFFFDPRTRIFGIFGISPLGEHLTGQFSRLSRPSSFRSTRLTGG